MQDHEEVDRSQEIRDKDGRLVATLTLWKDGKATICVRDRDTLSPECYTSEANNGRALFELATGYYSAEYLGIKDGLKSSIHEEQQAQENYKFRMRMALDRGDERTNRVYGHALREEEQHEQQFRVRLKELADESRAGSGLSSGSQPLRRRG